MRILQVSTAETAGGAERVARRLFQEYRCRGHESWLAVGRKSSDDPGVLVVPTDRPDGLAARFCGSAASLLGPFTTDEGSARQTQELVQKLPDLPRWVRWQLGIEELDFPSSRRLLALPPGEPDVIHCHNLHGQVLPRGGYFDLRALPALSHRLPVVLTLHDTWMLSGHCAYTLGCQRWKIGCGHCPDLTIYPSIRRDASAYNWRRKRAIYRQSRLYVATPSRWLMDQVEQSILAPAVAEGRVIPNGVDLDVFHPADKAAARAALGIRATAPVLLFVANGIRQNVFKDYPTIRDAFARVAKQTVDRGLLLIALGEDAPTERVGAADVQFVPHRDDPTAVARYYQAADIYVHAARADTFPNVVLEALACGTPTVATAVGGIPEQVDDGRTGFLVPAGDSQAMAERILQILGDDSLRAAFGERAAEDARRRFDHRRQVDTYLAWYEALVRRPSTTESVRRN